MRRSGISYQLGMEGLKMWSPYRLVGYRPMWIVPVSLTLECATCWPLSLLCRPGEREISRLLCLPDWLRWKRHGTAVRVASESLPAYKERIRDSVVWMLGLYNWVALGTGLCLGTGASRPKGMVFASSSPSLHHLYLELFDWHFCFTIVYQQSVYILLYTKYVHILIYYIYSKQYVYYL